MNTKTNKKRKIITALIALMLVVSLAGCDKAANDSSDSVDAVVATTENESVEYTTASDSEDITQSDVTTTTTGIKETTTEPTTESTAVTSATSGKTKTQTQKKTTKASATKATTQKVVNQSPITTYATTKVTAKATTKKPVVTTAKKTTKKPVVTTKKATTVKKKTTTAKKTTKRATTTNYWCDDGGTHHIIDVGVIGWHKTYEEAEKAAIAWSLKYLPDSSISYQIEECDACGLFTTLYIIDNDKGVTY